MKILQTLIKKISNNFPNIIHAVGHGIGLEIHELPYLSGMSQIELKENMIVTVEPGLYFDSWGGVRIEDDVLVTGKGCEILNKSSKELIIIE